MLSNKSEDVSYRTLNVLKQHLLAEYFILDNWIGKIQNNYLVVGKHDEK